MKVDFFFFLNSRRGAYLSRSSFIMVRGNSTAGVDTQVVINTNTINKRQIGGLVQAERKNIIE